MKIGTYNIKPILITLSDTPEWIERANKGKAYLAEQGIDDYFELDGFHGDKWGIAGRHIYLADGRPEEQYYIGHGKVAGNLTQAMSFRVMDALPDTHFLSLEDDCRLVPDWRPKLEQALLDVPPDFDFLFAGNCCCSNLDPVHVKGNIYHFPYRGPDKWNWYPQCSHMLIIAKKCVPYLIKTNRSVASPSDVSLVQNSFPKLKIYAILPRIANQESTNLPD